MIPPEAVAETPENLLGQPRRAWTEILVLYPLDEKYKPHKIRGFRI